MAGAAALALALGVAGPPAGGDEPSAEPASPASQVTYVRVRKKEDRRVVVGVRARDPDATVTEIDISWGDGRGTFYLNRCSAFTDGEEGPHTGKTISFRRLTHRYPRRGKFTMTVTAVSHRCPEHTDEQVGPPVTRKVHIGG
jgi:hypothetical protein